MHDAAARSKLIVTGLDECLAAGLTHVQTNDDRMVAASRCCARAVMVLVLCSICSVTAAESPVVGPQHAGQDVSSTIHLIPRGRGVPVAFFALMDRSFPPFPLPSPDCHTIGRFRELLGAVLGA